MTTPEVTAPTVAPRRSGGDWVAAYATVVWTTTANTPAMPRPKRAAVALVESAVTAAPSPVSVR